MVDDLYAHYKVQKSYFIMLDVCFDIWKSSVWMVHVLYTCFYIWKGFVTIVNVLYTPFQISKSYYRMVEVCFHFRKSCVDVTRSIHAFSNMEKLLQDGRRCF